MKNLLLIFIPAFFLFIVSKATGNEISFGMSVFIVCAIFVFILGIGKMIDVIRKESSVGSLWKYGLALVLIFILIYGSYSFKQFVRNSAKDQAIHDISQKTQENNTSNSEGYTQPKQQQKNPSPKEIRQKCAMLERRLLPLTLYKHNMNSVQGKVVSVLSGDTFTVKIKNKEYVVNPLHVEAPETKTAYEPLMPYDMKSYRFAKEMLPVGKTITLDIRKNEVGENHHLIAYIYVDGKIFNEMILKKGLARFDNAHPDYKKYNEAFKQAAKEAKEAEQGIWSIPGYVTSGGFNQEAVHNQGKRLPHDVAVDRRNANSYNFGESAEEFIMKRKIRKLKCKQNKTQFQEL